MFANTKLIISKVPKNTINYEVVKDELSTLELYSNNVLTFLIYILERITKFNSVTLEKEIEKINWLDNQSIYKIDIIPELYDILNELCQKLKNEKLVEGTIITPDWYIKQKISAEYNRIISKKLDDIIELFDRYILSLKVADQPLLSSFLIQKGLEIINKLNYRFVELKKSVSGVSKLELLEKEFEWIKPDFDKIQKQCEDYEKQCLIILSENLVNISKVVWINQFPDVFGQSYGIISNYINRYFKVNNGGLISKIFPHFLESSLIAFNQLNERYKDYYRPERISYQVLIDTMEISGYAYIYSKLYKNDSYWLNVKESWDKLFTGSEENIKLLVHFYKYYKTELYGVGINFNDKHQRSLTLRAIFEDAKVDIDTIDDCYINVFIEKDGLSSFFDVAEIFIEKYLFQLKVSDDIKGLIDRRLYDHCLRKEKIKSE